MTDDFFKSNPNISNATCIMVIFPLKRDLYHAEADFLHNYMYGFSSW